MALAGQRGANVSPCQTFPRLFFVRNADRLVTTKLVHGRDSKQMLRPSNCLHSSQPIRQRWLHIELHGVGRKPSQRSEQDIPTQSLPIISYVIAKVPFSECVPTSMAVAGCNLLLMNF